MSTSWPRGVDDTPNNLVIVEYDAKKLLKAFKKVCDGQDYCLGLVSDRNVQEFACNGNIVDDAELGQVIQLQGDQRQKIQTFLVEQGIDKKTIVLHGF